MPFMRVGEVDLHQAGAAGGQRPAVGQQRVAAAEQVDEIARRQPARSDRRAGQDRRPALVVHQPGMIELETAQPWFDRVPAL